MYETVIYWSLGEAYILCGSVMRSVEPLDPMDSIFSFFLEKENMLALEDTVVCAFIQSHFLNMRLNMDLLY